MALVKINKREINWSLQRMARIINIWRKLHSADRTFLFDKFCDEYPAEFWETVNRKTQKSA